MNSSVNINNYWKCRFVSLFSYMYVGLYICLLWIFLQSNCLQFGIYPYLVGWFAAIKVSTRNSRLTMSPQGTVVTFSEDIGLPSIFQMGTNGYSFATQSLNIKEYSISNIWYALKTCVSATMMFWIFQLSSPPREKCAGPNCTNEYKYRDSRSKPPLCSLGCYRALHEKIPPVDACCPCK